MKRNGHPLYDRWWAMRYNCGYCRSRPTAHNMIRTYSHVDVYPAWVDSFERYEKDMIALGWREGMLVSRRDKRQGFFPGNIVVSFGKFDSQNYMRTRRRLVAYEGQMMSLRDVIKKVNPTANWNLVNARICRGWDVISAILEPHHISGKGQGSRLKAI